MLLRCSLVSRVRKEAGVPESKEAAHEGAQEARAGWEKKSQGLQRECALADEPGGAQREAETGEGRGRISSAFGGGSRHGF